MAMPQVITQLIHRVRRRLEELTMRVRNQEMRTISLERKVAEIMKDPHARPLAPGSPFDQLVDIVPVHITAVVDDENGEYTAVRQVPASHGVMENDPDDTTPLTIRTVKDEDGNAPTLSVGAKVYVKCDGTASDGTPYYHVVSTAAKGSWYGILTKCNSTTGRGKVKKAEGEIGNLSIVDGAEEVEAYIGIKSWARKDDEVQCVPNGSGITPEWTAHVIISGIIFKEPCVEGTQGCQSGDALAAEQDNPAEVTDCGDVI